MAEYDEYYEPSTIADSLSDALAEAYDSGINLDKVEHIFNPDESGEEYNNFNAPKGLLKVGGALAALKYGKRAVAKGIDTYGFGANVTGSYKGDSKIAQYTNNLITSAKGSKLKVPLEAFKSLIASNKPVELAALDSSLEALQNYMSKLKSTGRAIPAHIKNYYLDLQTMAPERRMAQAVLQKSFNQPVNFKHGGKFIYNTFPQADPDIGKALSDKGFNLKKPITNFDVSNDKFMIKKLRTAATGDPRVQLITKALKENRIKDAKRYARKGNIKYKGNIIKGGRPLNLIPTENGYTLKINPQFVKRGGELASVKEYVVGGHSQKINFKKYKGHQGFHKSTTDVFDITTYKSAGEKFSIKGNPFTNARVIAAGEVGRKLGVHQPIVTTATYNHRAPGAGRKAGIVNKYKSKSRKFRDAGTRTYTGNKLQKKPSPKILKNRALKLALALATKGKVKLK